MKALIKSSFAFMLLCIFSSCAKDDSISSEDALRAPQALAGADVSPSLIVLFDPEIGVQNQSVTVKGTFDASTGVAVPNCGKLQLFQKIAGNLEAVGSQTTVTTTVKEVTWSFIPTVVGDDVYEFKVNYIKAGCADYKTEASSSFFLDVVEPCNGLTLEGSATGAPCLDATGMYNFQITYVVKACNIEYDYLKLQGGLTAASTLVNATAGYAWEVGNGNNPNSIIKWIETATLPGGTKTYTATFRKAYAGSGPMTITGNWSVKASMNGVETAVAEFAPITFGN